MTTSNKFYIGERGKFEETVNELGFEHTAVFEASLVLRRVIGVAAGGVSSAHWWRLEPRPPWWELRPEFLLVERLGPNLVWVCDAVPGHLHDHETVLTPEEAIAKATPLWEAYLCRRIEYTMQELVPLASPLFPARKKP